MDTYRLHWLRARSGRLRRFCIAPWNATRTGRSSSAPGVSIAWANILDSRSSLVISDLAAVGELAIDADVLVIGAGTVGLVVAVQLAKRGHSVVVVESGARDQAGETHEYNEVVQT